MIKIKVLTVFLLVVSLFLVSPYSASAQSPIRCGLGGEPCCNLAGGPPNSCQTGLQCSGGVCVAIPGVATPLPRGGVNVTPQPPVEVLCGTGIRTAIGCIHVLNNDKGVTFMGDVLRWSVGIGSGIAFILIIYASFMVMTSQGNPERLKAGQELLTSAISGLLLLIFSIFILNFIGIDILGLNAFGFGQP